jgi:hypothetical protein
MDMKADYIVACGIAWRNMADPVAGSELLEALQSEDQEASLLAHALLAESGETSMSLLESAVATGVVSPERAGPCMAAILRSQIGIEDWVTCERTQT